YRLLWGERRVVSVANLTLKDGAEFFSIAKATGFRCVTSVYALERANDALNDLRAGRLTGAAVIVPSSRILVPDEFYWARPIKQSDGRLTVVEVS
ncbi:hypothetical protein ACC734_37900, partial [Rhizobium ruizarguesonis]